MSRINELLNTFHEAAAHPWRQKEKYLAAGKKIILTAPVYTPEEIIHSMGLLPIAAWGADIELNESKKYFPAFICSIMQSILELGIGGTYEGADEDVAVPAITAVLVASNELDEDLVYQITKVLFENKDELTNAKKSYISPESAIKGVPTSESDALAGVTGGSFHPGAVKYYKEIGIMQ